MRTYTVRDVRRRGRRHPAGRRHRGARRRRTATSGPGCAWAARAAVGDRLVLMAPRRGQFYGGIEFEPGTARRLLLVGDETAVPAICAILGQLPVDADRCGVPRGADRGRRADRPAPRGGRGRLAGPRRATRTAPALHPAVLDHLGVGAAPIEEPDEVDPDLWETPSYSSSGEDVESAPTVVGHDLDGPLRLDRRRVRCRHRAASGAGQGPRRRPAPGRLHGLLAPRRP